MWPRSAARSDRPWPPAATGCPAGALLSELALVCAGWEIAVRLALGRIRHAGKRDPGVVHGWSPSGSGHGLQHAAGDLVSFHGFVLRAEIAGAEALVALALDQL